MISKEDLAKLDLKDPRVKYGFGKELLKVAARNPAEIYSYFDKWVKLLSSKNNILIWTATDIIGYLSEVDKENRIEEIIPVLLKLLHEGHLITCNHAIFAWD